MECILMVSTGELERISWEIGVDTHPLLYIKWASLVAQLVRNPPAMGDLRLTSGLGISPADLEWLPTPVFWPGIPWTTYSMGLQRVGHG